MWGKPLSSLLFILLVSLISLSECRPPQERISAVLESTGGGVNDNNNNPVDLLSVYYYDEEDTSSGSHANQGPRVSRWAMPASGIIDTPLDCPPGMRKHSSGQHCVPTVREDEYYTSNDNEEVTPPPNNNNNNNNNNLGLEDSDNAVVVISAEDDEGMEIPSK